MAAADSTSGVLPGPGNLDDLMATNDRCVMNDGPFADASNPIAKPTIPWLVSSHMTSAIRWRAGFPNGYGCAWSQ
jgi:hypothetical protein